MIVHGSGTLQLEDVKWILGGIYICINIIFILLLLLLLLLFITLNINFVIFLSSVINYYLHNYHTQIVAIATTHPQLWMELLTYEPKCMLV